MWTESPVRVRRIVEGGDPVRTVSVEDSESGALQQPQKSKKVALDKLYILSAIYCFPSDSFSQFSSAASPPLSSLILLFLSSSRIPTNQCLSI